MQTVAASLIFADKVAADVIASIRDDLGGGFVGTDQQAIDEGFKGYCFGVYQKRMRQELFPAAVAAYTAIVDTAKADSAQALLDIKTAEAVVNAQLALDFSGV